MSSEDEKVDINELKAAEQKDASEDVKERVTEAQKRYEVAREIEEHPVFKSLKVATGNTEINIMLDAIVDRYFEFVSGVDDQLPNYSVDSELIQMALNQTIYLISVTENGVVLNEHGEFDEDASKSQQDVMGVLDAFADTSSTGDIKEEFKNLLDIGSKTIPELGNTAYHEDTDFLMKMLRDMSKDDWENYMETPEGQEQLKKALDSKKTRKSINDNRIKANLEDEEDVRIKEAQGRLYAIATKGNLKRTDYQAFYECLQELQEFAEGGAKDFVDPKTGKIDPAKALEDYTQYIADYSSKENEKVLRQYGANRLRNAPTFKDLPDDDRRKLMEAALSLYMQPGGTDKEEATIVLASMGLLKSDTVNGSKAKVLNRDAFRREYNSTRKGQDMTFEQIVSFVYQNDTKATREHTEMLYQQVLDGTFKERYDTDLAKNAINENDSKGYDDDDDQRFQDIYGMSLDGKEVKQKEKFWDKAQRRLDQDYKLAHQKSAMKQLDKMIDKAMKEINIKEYLNNEELEKDTINNEKSEKDIIDDIRRDCVKRAYYSSSVALQSTTNMLNEARAANDVAKIEELRPKLEEARRTFEFMKDYVLDHKSEYGSFINQGEVVENKIKYDYVHWTSTKESDKALVERLNKEGLSPSTIYDTVNQVAQKGDTIPMLISGALESARDLAGVLYRRVQFSKLGRFLGNTVLTLTDESSRGTGDVSNLVDAKYNDKLLDSVGQAFSEGKSLDEFQKEQAQKRKIAKVNLEVPELSEKEAKEEARQKKKREKEYADYEKKKEREAKKKSREESKKLKSGKRQEKQDINEDYKEISSSMDEYKVENYEQPENPIMAQFRKSAELRAQWSSLLLSHGLPQEQIDRMSTMQLGNTLAKFGYDELLADQKKEYQETKLQAKAMDTITNEEQEIEDDDLTI